MIVAPQRGARGESADDLIVDELREMEDFDFIAAAQPTLTESDNPQTIYLSNAGTEASVVLNDLRARGIKDTEGLAYMEWSADPVYSVDDERGWLQANPSIGYSNLTIDRLRQIYNRYSEAGELAVFENDLIWVLVK
jgi:phage terminase large subunit-like protein